MHKDLELRLKLIGSGTWPKLGKAAPEPKSLLISCLMEVGYFEYNTSTARSPVGVCAEIGNTYVQTNNIKEDLSPVFDEM